MQSGDASGSVKAGKCNRASSLVEHERRTKQASLFLQRSGVSFKGLNDVKDRMVDLFRANVAELPLEFEPEVCSICLDSSDDRVWWKHRACSDFFHRPCVQLYVFHKRCAGVQCPVCYQPW